jgi:hypothetical protein
VAEPKTKLNNRSVEKFLNGVKDEKKRQDSFAVLALMKEATRAEPRMWGSSIVGFGSYHYKYASGREGDAPLTGFSPRKQSLTLYIMSGFEGYDALLQKLGKYSTGKGCLYIKRLEDVDLPALKKLVQQSVKHMAKTHASNLKG